MRRRRYGSLGLHRPTRYVIEDVNYAAIPRMKLNYRKLGPDEVALPGDAPKDLVVVPSGDDLRTHAYIAKAPRCEGYRECVTEHLIAKIGGQLPMRVAHSALVRLATPPHAPPDIRFMSRLFTRKGERLVHGVELVAQRFDVDQDTLEREVMKKHERGFYTVDLVCDVLKAAVRHRQQSAVIEQAVIGAFARMVAFDALVGSNDRHAMNWGIVVRPDEPSWPIQFAPIFDTARGLFWNLDDRQLADGVAKNGRAQYLANYANRSMPLISVPGSGGVPKARKSNHFDLIEHVMAEKHLGLGQHVRTVVRAFRPVAARQLLHYEFGRVLSRLRLDLIDDLLQYRFGRLSKLCEL